MLVVIMISKARISENLKKIDLIIEICIIVVYEM